MEKYQSYENTCFLWLTFMFLKLFYPHYFNRTATSKSVFNRRILRFPHYHYKKQG